MQEKTARVYMGTLTQRQTRNGTQVISGKFGAANITLWPARTPGKNGETRWNVYLEEPLRKDEGERVPSGTQQEEEEAGDGIPF